MAIESDDEARRAAEAIIADVGSGEIAAAEDFVALYSDPDDALWIGRYLSPMLQDAVARHEAGDDSPETARLTAFLRNMTDDLRVLSAETAAVEAERAAARRAATMPAIQAAPDIGHRMTGVGPHGLPLPDDAVPDGNVLVTRVATPEALMAFYIERMRATGWTVDLDHSRPLTETGFPPQCYFSRPDIPCRYISILTGPGVDDPGLIRLSISEHDD